MKIIKSGGAKEKRKIVLASGGSTEINAAIVKLNAAGGGTLVIDGLLDLDGDVTMLSDVLVKGNGPGTGLRNNTANDYAINIIGSTPTFYDVGSPVGSALTTDTAGDAANFSKDDFILIKQVGTYAYGFAARASVDGVAGTGVVSCYQRVQRTGLNGDAVAAPLSGAVDQAGIENCAIKNTSTGSLTVVVQYATRTRLHDVTFDETKVSLDQSIRTDITECVFTASNTLTFSRHIELLTFVCETRIDGCKFNNAEYGLIWDITTVNGMSDLEFSNCENSCWRGIYLFPSASAVGNAEGIAVRDSKFKTGYKPDGTTGGIGIYFRFSGSHINVQNNKWAKFDNTGLSIHYDNGGTSYSYSRCIVANNQAEGGISLENLRYSSIDGNYGSAAFTMDSMEYCSISGNRLGTTYLRDQDLAASKNNTITGNYFDTFIINGDASYICDENVISGNTIEGDLTGTTHIQNCIFDGNKIGGNITFTTTVANSLDRNIFTNNHVDGNFSITSETNHDDWTIADNEFNGTVVYPTGDGNKIEQAGSYSEQDTTIRLAAGGSTEVNAAIAKLNGMGGGTVILDTIIDMDADIDLLANVFLKGNGPNTGLRNNTANDYAINFVGSISSWYEINTPNDQGFTCDTAGEAVNFSQGDSILLRDVSTTNIGVISWVVASANGNAGSGLVTTFKSSNLYGLGGDGSQAAVISGIKNSGVGSMDIKNTSSGTLKINLQYAEAISILDCNFYEATVEIDSSANTSIKGCNFALEDNTAPLESWIKFIDQVVGCEIRGCRIVGATYGIYGATTIRGGIASILICENTISSRNGVYFNRGASASRIYGMHISILGNQFIDAQDGAGNAGQSGVYSLLYSYFLDISANTFDTSYATASINLAYYANCYNQFSNVSNNVANRMIYVAAATGVTCNGNAVYSQMQFPYGPAQVSITGNLLNGLLYITDNNVNKVDDVVVAGNRISGAGIYATGDASRVFTNVTISSNEIDGYVSLVGNATKVNVIGNHIGTNLEFTPGAANLCENIVVTGNIVEGNFTIDYPDQDNWIVKGNQFNGTVQYLTGSNVSVDQPGHYSINDRVVRLAQGGSSEINAAIATLNALGGGTLFIDAMLDLDGDVTVLSNVEIIGQGQATGFRNSTANDYDIDFVGTTPTFYAIGSPGNGSITTDTPAEAGNFSRGDMIFLKDVSGGIAVCGSTEASADGDTDTGEILCFINPDIYQFGTGGSAAPITGMDNARLKNLALENTSTGTLEVDMQYATRCGIEQCTFLEAQVKIDTCIDTAIEGCKFELEDNVTPLPQWVTLVDQISRLDITECFFMGGYYGVYAPAATAVFVDQLTVRHSTFTTLYAIYLDHAASPANIWFSGVDINNNSFFGSQDGAGNTSGTAIFIEAGLFNFNIADNIIGAEYATGIDLDDFAGATRQYGSIVGNTCFIGCNFEAIKQTTVTGNCFLGVCVFDYGPQNCNISANTMAGFYMRDSNRAGVYENVVTGNVINSVAYIQGDATYPCERLIFSDNFVDGAIYLESHFNDCVFKGNIFDGNVEFTTATANSLDGMMFTENTVLGNFVVTTETDHDDWVISLNRITGTITQLTGSNNRVLPFNQERYDDLKIGPGSFVLAGSANPSLEDWQPGGTGPTFKVYKFRVNDEVFAWKQIPHDWKEGSDLKPHIHWTPADRGNEESGNLVGWKIDYTITDVSGVFPTGQTLDFSDACSGVDDTHEVTASLTISGASLNASCMLAIRIYRSDTGTDDTWAGTTAAQSPGLLEVDIHYQKDDIGSDAEFVKD